MSKKMTLSQIEAIVEYDLVWFYNNAEADIGIKSNWQAMVNSAMFGQSTSDSYDHTTSSSLNAVERYRRIDRILKSLPKYSRDILYVMYSDLKLNPNVVKMFHKLTGAAYLNSFIDVKSLNKLCDSFAKDKSDKNPENYLLISKIRIEANKRYQNTIISYVKNRMIKDQK